MGKRQILTAFLEKDNIKLVVFETSGKTAVRAFAGQISFQTEVVRDAFIADSVKFSNQVKIALAQKPQLSAVSEVVLFVPPDKTFTKAIPAADSVESFVRSLPYFKEELVIKSPEGKPKSPESLQTHVAFEKKLIEDFERPFLESGKKVISVESSLNDLARFQRQPNKYFLFVPFEKDTAVAVCDHGEVLEIAAFPKDAFVSRLIEFIAGHNHKDVTNAYTLGIFDSSVVDKIKSQTNLNVSSLVQKDIYDLVVESYLHSAPGGGFAFSLPNLPKLPPISPKLIFLIGAIIVGFLLVYLVANNLTKLTPKPKSPVVSPSGAESPAKPPAPAPQPKPADYKVRVLNGTLVTGEAGNLGDSLKALGYDVTETTNATSAGFVATRLRVTPDVPQQIIDQITTTLNQTYQSVSLEPLTDQAVKIEIIIGQKKS